MVFFDSAEKRFRVLGFVETWDTEDFATIDQTEKEHYVAPVEISKSLKNSFSFP